MDPTPEQKEAYIAIWSKVVETQMHFNEMSVKSRQLGLTFVSAALGIAVVMLAKKEDYAVTVPICGHELVLHISVLLVLAALIALSAVRNLDLNVYHRMLRGAVAFNDDFEQNYMKKIFNLEKGMTQAISHYSRYEDAGTDVDETGRMQYTGQAKVTAEQKIGRFYSRTIAYLVLTIVFLVFVTNWGTWSNQ